MLRPMRKEWEMSFAKSAKAALNAMAEKHFDVVVSDMRMPDMDGAELLNEVSLKYPKCVRIILSGQYSKEAFFASLGAAHQFLSKPCDAKTLKDTIARAFAVRDLIQNENVKALISRLHKMPVIPTIYKELMVELKSKEPSLRKIGAIIEKDVIMSAKILQVVNSAYFGLSSRITRPSQAVVVLGMDTIRSLVLVANIFSEYDNMKNVYEFSVESIWNHSVVVSNYSKSIIKHEGADSAMEEVAFTAGMMHDVGKLILATNLPEEYEEVLSIAFERSIPIEFAEEQIFGATHAEIGAYLLGLWGLPDYVVYSVAFHHNPFKCDKEEFSTLLPIIHVANAFSHLDISEDFDLALLDLDPEFFCSTELVEQLKDWQNVCRKIEKEN